MSQLVRILQTFFPLAYIDIVRRMLVKDAESILDIGCGDAQRVEFLHRRIYLVGGDASKHSLSLAKKRKAHEDLIRFDARKLPFREASFDVTLCLEVIEHLSKSDCNELLECLERVSTKQVIIGTPVGFAKSLRHRHDELDFELDIHRSGWTPTEFRERGYIVRGFGLRALRSIYEQLTTFPKGSLVGYAIASIGQLYSPLILYRPTAALNMVCSKHLNQS